MAGRILAAVSLGVRMLAVAGNAHTPTSHTDLGVPLGARLARQRPGVREIRISYGGGCFYNLESRQFGHSTSPQEHVRLYERGGELVLDLPLAGEAVVPHRTQPPQVFAL
jgi:hypothetical protein